VRALSSCAIVISWTLYNRPSFRAAGFVVCLRDNTVSKITVADALERSEGRIILINAKRLLDDLKRLLKRLEDDLRSVLERRGHADRASAEYMAAKEAGRAGEAFEVWREGYADAGGGRLAIERRVRAVLGR